MAEDQFYHKTMLRSRGWTDLLIDQLLGPPDETKTNAHRQSGPPMQLFDIARVEVAELHPDFIAYQQSASKRRAGARRGAKTKRAKLEAYVDSIEVAVPTMEKEEVIRRAWNHYQDRSGNQSSTRDPDSEFLNRICVNYLRHELTQYERHLAELFGKVGVSDAYLELKDKVLDAIEDVYHFLATECRRQSNAAHDADLHRYL